MRAVMKVGIDARIALENARGWGRYASELLPALAALPIDLRVALPRSEAAERVAASLDARVVFLDPPTDVGDTRVADVDEAILPERAFGEVDVIHSLTRFVLPTRVRPVIATVHDVAPFGDPPSRLALRDATALAVRTLQRPGHHMIAVSEFTRQELLRRLDASIDDVVVIHHGVSSTYTRDATVPRERAVLYVGGAGVPKNFETLQTAMRVVRDRHPNCALWIAGDHAWGWDAHVLEPWVRFHGFIGEESLRDLYRRASVLAFPSRYEGFGLPLLEAMACGLPVVCSDIPPFREVAGDAARYVDPLSVSALAEAIESALDRPVDPAIGCARAAMFDWATTAARIVDCYRRWHAQWHAR